MVSAIQAVRCAAGACFSTPSKSAAEEWKRRGLTAILFLLQPLARLVGRVPPRFGYLAASCGPGWTLPRSWLADLWTPETGAIDERLKSMEAALRRQGVAPVRGE